MTLLISCIALGAVVFVEQPLPGLEVGSRAFPAALAITNAVTADFDRDGAADLLLPSGVWLQRAGAFPRTTMVPLPAHERAATLHAESGRIFIYYSGRLTCHSLVTQRWQLDWEASVDSEPDAMNATAPLFHDLDADGRAELVLPLEHTLRIHRMTPGAPLAGDLDVYPPARPRIDPKLNLWTSQARPETDLRATREVLIDLDAHSLTAREPLATGDSEIEFRSVLFSVSLDERDRFVATAMGEIMSAVLPREMVSCRLRRDGALAFAGARAIRSARFQLGSDIAQVSFASGTGKLQVIRTRSAIPMLGFADFDANGSVDLLTQTNSIDSGSPREVLMALASARKVRHEFHVHVQADDGRFNQSPRMVHAVELHLGTALQGGPRWEAYRRGELTCASGDFDGDGRADIAVWTDERVLAVWLNHEGRFEPEPDIMLSPPSGRGFTVADVDQDSRADIILLDAGPIDAGPRVWFSR